jgi:uncharacterized membrane protein
MGGRMSQNQQAAHDRMQAEKAFAVEQLKRLRRKYEHEHLQLRGSLEYQRARIAALEIEVEELRAELQSARQTP